MSLTPGASDPVSVFGLRLGIGPEDFRSRFRIQHPIFVSILNMEHTVFQSWRLYAAFGRSVDELLDRAPPEVPR